MLLTADEMCSRACSSERNLFYISDSSREGTQHIHTSHQNTQSLAQTEGRTTTTRIENVYCYVSDKTNDADIKKISTHL